MKRLALVLPLFLAACVAPETLLRNDVTGQVINCRSLGIGVFASAVAIGTQQDCVDRYKTNGFHEISVPGPFTQVGKDGVIQLAFPAGWAVLSQLPGSPLVGAQINAQEVHARMDLIVTTVPRTDVKDLTTYANALRTDFFKGDSHSKASDLFETKINGRRAILFDKSGTAQGVNIHVVATAVELNEIVAVIAVRTLASNFPAFRSEMEGLASGISETDAINRSQPIPASLSETTASGSKFLSGDGKLQLMLSPNWSVRKGAAGAPQNDRIAAVDWAAGGSINVTSCDVRDVSDIVAYVEAARANDAREIAGSTVSPAEAISVNGHSAYRYTIVATQAGVNLHFVVTIVRLESRIANVVVAMTESRFADRRSEMEAVAANLTELPATAK